MENVLCLVIVLAVISGLLWVSYQFGPEPGYDWPVLYYRVKLWWAARRRARTVVYRRTALGRMPGESAHDWARRRDARARWGVRSRH